ncbi:hypothetical protein O3P69_000436 [Scylla paramamosain]|uniref:Uncharacterized protein n=1 Tax=Scylla paramamosain TaxID=85552 RepID=A0AAW0UUV4_SCYPA
MPLTLALWPFGHHPSHSKDATEHIKSFQLQMTSVRTTLKTQNSEGVSSTYFPGCLAPHLPPAPHGSHFNSVFFGILSRIEEEEADRCPG